MASYSDGTSQYIYVADTGNNRVLKLMIPQDAPGNMPAHAVEKMKASMIFGDPPAAAGLFLSPFQTDYQDMFTEFSADLPSLGACIGQLQPYSIKPTMVIYEFADNNTGLLYPIIFEKDENGVWKISKF